MEGTHHSLGDGETVAVLLPPRAAVSTKGPGSGVEDGDDSVRSAHRTAGLGDFMGGSFPLTKHVAQYIVPVAKFVTGLTPSCVWETRCISPSGSRVGLRLVGRQTATRAGRVKAR